MGAPLAKVSIRVSRFTWSMALAVAAIGVAAAGCNKNEGGAGGAPAEGASAAAASPTANAAATGSAPAASAAAPSASASASASAAAAEPAAGDAGSAASAGGATGATGATGASDASTACGKKPLPDCPLQGWMKKNMGKPMAANDLPAVASALDQVVKMAPPGYTNWASISRDGAAAARAGDESAVKSSCRGCHDQYKRKYKDEMRTRPVTTS